MNLTTDPLRATFCRTLGLPGELFSFCTGVSSLVRPRSGRGAPPVSRSRLNSPRKEMRAGGVEKPLVRASRTELRDCFLIRHGVYEGVPRTELTARERACTTLWHPLHHAVQNTRSSVETRLQGLGN